MCINIKLSKEDFIEQLVDNRTVEPLHLKLLTNKQIYQLLTYLYITGSEENGQVQISDEFDAYGWTTRELEKVSFLIRSRWNRNWHWIAYLTNLTGYMKYFLEFRGDDDDDDDDDDDKTCCTVNKQEEELVEEIENVSEKEGKILERLWVDSEVEKLMKSIIQTRKDAQDLLFAIPLTCDATFMGKRLHLLTSLWSLLFTMEQSPMIDEVAARCLLRHSAEENRNAIIQTQVSSLIIGQRLAQWATHQDKLEIASKWLLMLYWICVQPCHKNISVSYPPNAIEELSKLDTKLSVAGTPVMNVTQFPVDEWRATSPSMTIMRNEAQWKLFFDTLLSVKLSPSKLIGQLFSTRAATTDTLLTPLSTTLICTELNENPDCSLLKEALAAWLASLWASHVWVSETIDVALAFGLSSLCKVTATSHPVFLSESLVTTIEKGILLRNAGYDPLRRMLACVTCDNLMRLRMNVIRPQTPEKPLIMDYWVRVTRNLYPCLKADSTKADEAVDTSLLGHTLPSVVILALMCVGGVVLSWKGQHDVYALAPPQSSSRMKDVEACFHYISENEAHEMESSEADVPGNTDGMNKMESCESWKKQVSEDVTKCDDEDERSTQIETLDVSGDTTQDMRLKELLTTEIQKSSLEGKATALLEDTSLVRDIRKIHRQVTDPFFPSDSMTHCVTRLKSFIMHAEVNQEGASLELKGMVDSVARRLTPNLPEQRFLYHQAVQLELPYFLEDLLLKRLSPMLLEDHRSKRKQENLMDFKSGLAELLCIGLDLAKVLLDPASGRTADTLAATTITLGMAIMSIWLTGAICTAQQLESNQTFTQIYQSLPQMSKDTGDRENNPLWKMLDEALCHPFQKSKSTQSRLLLNDALRHSAFVLAGVRPLHGGTSNTLPFLARKALSTYTLPLLRSTFKCLVKSSQLCNPKAPLELGPMSLLVQNMSLILGFSGNSMLNQDLVMTELESCLSSIGYEPFKDPLMRRSGILLAGTVDALLRCNRGLKEITPRSLVLRLNKYLRLGLEQGVSSDEQQSAAAISTSLKLTYSKPVLNLNESSSQAIFTSGILRTPFCFVG